MQSYKMPFEASVSEFHEKRSRFISHVWPVISEQEAKDYVTAMKKQYHDANHNCWCYRIREGGIVRYSDDGEPQGTAGLPMLNVFERQDITNVCCVVTRYFGGVLLGAGGLTRAYSKGAADGLSQSGIALLSPWSVWEIACPYPLFERIKLEVEAVGGVVREAVYGADIALEVGFAQGGAQAFAPRLQELSAGRVGMEELGTEFMPQRMD